MQALIAILAGSAVPFVCTETHELGEETIASYLYRVHLYHWLESNGHGRYLADQDCVARQRMLHEYLRKLLLTPDEFMQLLEDC